MEAFVMWHSSDERLSSSINHTHELSHFSIEPATIDGKKSCNGSGVSEAFDWPVPMLSIQDQSMFCRCPPRFQNCLFQRCYPSQNHVSVVSTCAQHLLKFLACAPHYVFLPSPSADFIRPIHVHAMAQRNF